MALTMIRLVLSLMTFLFIANSAIGGEPTSTRRCTKKEAMAADKEAAYLDSWTAIYRSFRKYHHCDDGAIATGYTDSVVRNLVRNWVRLSELEAMLRRDLRFEAFVLRHISATALTEDLQRIKTSECPKGALGLCKKVQQAAERALSSS